MGNWGEKSLLESEQRQQNPNDMNHEILIGS